MDDDNRQSADDALEPVDDIFSQTRDEEKLDQDNDPPDAPADDIKYPVNLDEPAGDTGVDADELYQEGLGGATNADDVEIVPDENPEPLETEDD
jgi:hypothetical protein